MNAIILCFLLGVVLLGFEVFLPGAIMGIIGGIVMLVGCVIAFLRYGVDGGATAVTVALGLVGITLYAELVLLPRTRFGRKMFLNTAVTGTSQPRPGPESFVGRTAEVITTLAPSGYVRIDGKQYEAQSVDGLVVKGAQVKVVGMDQFTLKVAKI